MKIRLEVSSVASKYRSGVSQYTRLLADALSSTKDVTTYVHYFDFLSRQPSPALLHTPKKSEANKLIPLKVYAKAQSLGFAPAFDPHLSLVDLTIFPNFATWPSVKTKHTATVIHDLTYLYFPDVVEEKNLAHLRRVVPRSIRKADFIITVSESVKTELAKEFNLNPDNCIVTPIPPDDTFFVAHSKSEINEVKKKYGINPDQKYIYFIGNLEPRKNLKTLVEAYCLLPKETKDTYTLVLAGGKGWKTEETQASIDAALQAGEHIQHLGFVDQSDSPALFQGAALFVMPSLYEGFGMPVLEAMAGGTPVVASDIPVLREVGMEYAHYADPLSAQSFADVIAKTLAEPRPDRAKLQENVHRYTWEENVQKIIKKTKELS